VPDYKVATQFQPGDVVIIKPLREMDTGKLFRVITVLIEISLSGNRTIAYEIRNGLDVIRILEDELMLYDTYRTAQRLADKTEFGTVAIDATYSAKDGRTAWLNT
jgi:hypothetical protein